MGLLIGNGSKLYRKSASLVRTPITITLSPDEMAVYQVANIYKNGWPYGGFVASASISSIESAGTSMRTAYVNGNASGVQLIWRHVTNTHEPENIFYQGAWAPSLGSQNERGEAYMQLGGYHFTIPQGLQSLNVMSAKLQITHGGTILCYQSAQSGKTNNRFSVRAAELGSQFVSAVNAGGWNQEWTQKVGIFSSLNNSATTMWSNAQDTIALSTVEESGVPRSYSRIWVADTGSSVDGCIPISSAPYVREYDLSSTIASFLSSNRAGWVATIPYVQSNGAPSFSNWSSMAFYWLCESHWGYRLILELG